MASINSTVSPQDLGAGPRLVLEQRPSGGRAAKSYIPAWMEWAWIAAIVALFAVHAVHLRADFPNYSPWMDYAKYTDEGWYGNGAIEAFLRGSWYVPGDFNSAVALPVLPVLEWVLFRFTGVSVVAARALAVGIFGASLWMTYRLVLTSPRRMPFALESSASVEEIEGGQPRWVALLAATLLAASSFLYCFGRLAILEPLVIFFLLLSWLLALGSGSAGGAGLRRSWTIQATWLIAIGLVLCLMVLTKTTAVVLLPSVFYLVWQANRGRTLKACSAVLLAMVLPLCAYYYLLVRPHYLVDFKYFFTANVYQQPTTAFGWMMAFWYAIHGGLWMDRTLFLLGVALVLASALWIRGLWRNPLYVAAVLAAALQIFFIGYHNNMQPRYYTVAAFPLCMLVALGAEALLRRQRALGTITLAVVAFSAMLNARHIIGYTRHPQYTFVSAAQNLTRYIDQHPNGNRLLLSISGNEIGLITGLPAICDDFGTLDLPLRIHKYQPGWYAAWNELDPGTLEDLHTQFRLEQVARFPAFDDVDRNVLILYKMHPLPLSQQRLDSDDGKDDGQGDVGVVTDSPSDDSK